jgi:hypothetical protein
MNTRIIAICLLISNIAVATAGYFLLTRTSQGYSELLQSSLPALNNIRALSWQTSRILRAFNRLADTPDEEKKQLLQRQLSDIEEAGSLLAIILTDPESLIPVDTKNRLQVAHNQYTAAILDWRAIVMQPTESATLAADVRKVRAAYDEYESLLDTLANDIHDHGVSMDSYLLASGRASGSNLLVAAAWPVWLGSLAVLLFGGFIAVMAFMLMRKAPDTFDN